MLALLLALITGAAPAALPTPAPQYHTIIHLMVSPVCATLRSTVAPVGFIAKNNDAAFAHVLANTAKVGKETSLLDGPTSAKMALTFLAHQDQTDVGIVYTNLALAKTLLDQSATQYPATEFPQVAVLRDRLRAVITMQQRYNSLIDGVSGSFLDNSGDKVLYGGFDGKGGDNGSHELLAMQQNANANRALLGEMPNDNSLVGGSEYDTQTPVIQRLHLLAKNGETASPGSVAAIVAGTLGTPSRDSEVLDAQRFDAAKSPHDAILRQEALLFGTAMRAEKLCSAVAP